MIRLGRISYVRPDAAGLWSLAAMVLAASAFAATVAVVLASGQDTSDVRWPLVVAPLVAAALAVAVPRRGVRTAAAIVLLAWCVLAAASVGLFFVPAALAAVVAAWRRVEIA